MLSNQHTPDNPDMPGRGKYLTPKQAAAKLNVSIRTLHRWEDDGLIHAYRLPSGHRRYKTADVTALLTR